MEQREQREQRKQREREEAQAFLREAMYNDLLTLEDGIGQHNWSRRQTQRDAKAVSIIRTQITKIANRLYHARHGIQNLFLQWEEYERGMENLTGDLQAVTSGLVPCPNHSFRLLHEEKRPCPVCALQGSVLTAKSHRADLVCAIFYLLEQRDDDDPDWDAAWRWVEAVMAQIPNSWAEGMIMQQRDRLAGALQGLVDALPSEYGSDCTTSWPGLLVDAGDNALQVLDDVRGAMCRVRRRFGSLGVGQTFYISSATFGTLAYEKIEPCRDAEGLDRMVNAKLIRAETVGIVADFASYDDHESVEVERFPELEEGDDERD